MSNGSRVFVALVFLVIGAAFVSTSAALIYEFSIAGDTRPIGEQRWFVIAMFYSHLFVFFPTFGIVALIAFYLPCAVFVDLYWHHIPAGKLRFMIGTVVVAGMAYLGAQALLAGDQRSIYELHPRLLEADVGSPPNCMGAPGSCKRLPMYRVLDNVRKVSFVRTGLSPFARDCNPDVLLEPPSDLGNKRFCFNRNDLPANQSEYLTAKECCAAQQTMIAWLSAQHKKPDGRSLTARVHEMALPAMVFFLLVVLIVGILLVWRHDRIYKHYADIAPRLEQGVLIGAIAMLFWPIMNHAFFQSASVIYGGGEGSLLRQLGPIFSLIYLGWSLLLLLYFYRRYERQAEIVAKVGGLIASGLAIINYNAIIDFFVWFAGSGATVYSLAFIIGLCLIALVRLSWNVSSIPPYRGGADGAAAAASARGGGSLDPNRDTPAPRVYRSDEPPAVP